MSSNKSNKEPGFIIRSNAAFYEGGKVISGLPFGPQDSRRLWASKNWVGNGSVTNVVEFRRFLNFIQLPQTTNIQAVRRLYHNFTLHTLLEHNGIDMCPVDRPAPRNISLLICEAVRGWFPKLRAVFLI